MSFPAMMLWMHEKTGETPTLTQEKARVCLIRSHSFWVEYMVTEGGFPMEKEKKKVEHRAYEIEDVGQVQIADEVVAVIAGLAATEVDGVSKMSGNITNEIVSKLGMKNLSKGVKVNIDGEHVDVVVNLVLRYGVSIPKTSQEVQEKVKGAIENMTGLIVDEVNIRIAGIQMDDE